jgi:hypothetical protein
LNCQIEEANARIVVRLQLYSGFYGAYFAFGKFPIASMLKSWEQCGWAVFAEGGWRESKIVFFV